jgi:hypothetical protein
LKPVQSKETLVSRLIAECDRQANAPPCVNGEPDPYFPMIAGALRRSLEVLPEDQQRQLAVAVNMKQEKWPFPTEFAFQHMVRGFQMRFMSNPENPDEYDMSYPYKTQQEWNERVAEVVNDKKEFTTLTNDMVIWNVGSDVETRAAGLKLVAHTILKEQVNDPNNPFSILIVGSARDHSLAMISGNVPFPEVRVAGYEREPEKQQFLQDTINKLLAKTITLGDSYGVDLWPLNDPLWSRFLESCRYYPSELQDPQKRSIYRYLEEVRDASPVLHHVDADYGKDNTRFSKRFNLVAFPTSLYQNHRQKRRVMVDRGMEDGDILLFQDFCKLKKVNTKKHPIDQLEFLGPTSKPYTYGTFIYDPKEPELGIQEFGYWNNGRCEVFRPSKRLACSLLGSEDE